MSTLSTSSWIEEEFSSAIFPEKRVASSLDDGA